MKIRFLFALLLSSSLIASCEMDADVSLHKLVQMSADFCGDNDLLDMCYACANFYPSVQCDPDMLETCKTYMEEQAKQFVLPWLWDLPSRLAEEAP